LSSGKASATLWSEEDFSCSICLDVFNSPVTTPCGHNFCRACITVFWDDIVQFKCPVCNELFHTRPVLRVNTLISGMAVKSCLVCLISYCQTHLEPHQRVAGLKKHRLVEPLDRLEDRMCKKHNQLLELFCQTDQVYVCQFCTVTDHKSHPVVPLKEEYEVKTAQPGKIEAELQQMIKERQRKIKDIIDTVDHSKADADREIADGVQVLTALRRSVEKCLDDHNKTVQEKLKSTEKEAEGLIKELEQEIKDLTNRSSEVKQFNQTEDHLHLLQTFRSLKDPPPTRDWTTAEVRPPSYIGTLRRALDHMLGHSHPYGPSASSGTGLGCSGPSWERISVRSSVLHWTHTCLISPSPPPFIYRSPASDRPPSRVFPLNACDLTLDPNTAHRDLSLSEDNRKVTWVEEDQSYPDHPDRFDSWPQVLGREALTGRCYWEVEWEGGVGIGVTYRGITRRGGGGDSRLGGNNKSWVLYCSDYGYSAWYNGTETDLPLPPAGSTRVGVYLDRPAGSLSFYRVSPGGGGSSDTLTHLHTFCSSFTQEDLLPGVGVGWSGASASLCRL
uniref:Uncharacterized protein n=1 Tax=Gadus morhua TaxID=8049 RepID=A0A8C5B3P0_GADMO